MFICISFIFRLTMKKHYYTFHCIIEMFRNLISISFCIMKVQGKDRLYVKFIAEQLGLDGSYVPRTYIEQIQLDKLVNDVMVLTSVV